LNTIHDRLPPDAPEISTKPGPTVQGVWTESLQSWPEHVPVGGENRQTLTYGDRHENPFSKRRKPDNVHFVRGRQGACELGVVVLGVVVLGDLKACVRSHFSPKSKGELLDMVEDFLNHQPETLGMTAYLTDGHHLQFFRVNKRVHSLLPFLYFESQCFDLARSGSLAMRWFWGLVTTRPQDLGWALPSAFLRRRAAANTDAVLGLRFCWRSVREQCASCGENLGQHGPCRRGASGAPAVRVGCQQQ